MEIFTPLRPLGDQNWPSSISGMVTGFAGALNVYRTMAHHPALLRAWEDLREHIVNRTTLGPQFSEVVILRTGVNLGSSYEWDQHVVRARVRGLTDERIASLRGPIGGMEPRDATLALAVDDLFSKSMLQPANAAAVVALVGREGLLDLMATVGFYSTLGFILNTNEVPLDSDIAAELLARPLQDKTGL